MRPVKIHQVAPDQLLVQWCDGHESRFGTEHLRALCPCALCLHEQEENLKNGIFSLPLAAKTRLVRIDPSGHNAIVITWGDGHSTGIYTWEYLRSICPCETCRKTML